jgi:hypothetical protein
MSLCLESGPPNGMMLFRAIPWTDETICKLQSADSET